MGWKTALDAKSAIVFDAINLLGVNADCTAQDVRRAYRKMLPRFHPDHNGNDHMMANLNFAKQVVNFLKFYLTYVKKWDKMIFRTLDYTYRVKLLLVCF